MKHKKGVIQQVAGAMAVAVMQAGIDSGRITEITIPSLNLVIPVSPKTETENEKETEDGKE
ncbi:MAG: hypothetical protein O2871_01315 [bacterium]|nr:hypothetical protein [bacterium]